MATFRLQVVSMDGLEYDGEVQRVKLRTIHGDLAILARHMNYVTRKRNLRMITWMRFPESKRKPGCTERWSGSTVQNINRCIK